MAGKRYNEFLWMDALAKKSDPYAGAKYDIVTSYIKESNSVSVLDVGCGSGYLSFRLGSLGYRVHGIDSSEAIIQIALQRKNMPHYKEMDNVTFELASLDNFSSDPIYDYVIALDILEHIQEDERAVEKMSAYLKKGGGIIISVPAIQWLYGPHDIAAGHFRRYSKDRLWEIVSPYFNIETIRTFGFTLIPVSLLHSKILRQPIYLSNIESLMRNQILSLSLRTILKFERHLPLPFGTSIILFASK